MIKRYLNRKLRGLVTQPVVDKMITQERELAELRQELELRPEWDMGVITCGELTFKIRKMYINQNHLVMWATCPAHITGRMSGPATLWGVDGTVAFVGKKKYDMGTKTTGQTWDMNYDLALNPEFTNPPYDWDKDPVVLDRKRHQEEMRAMMERAAEEDPW
jgi:hypothetical protein